MAAAAGWASRPYETFELTQVARIYMFRATLVASAAGLVFFFLALGGNLLIPVRPRERPVTVVPFHQLAPPPPLTPKTRPPQLAIVEPAAPPRAAVPVPVRS